MVLVVSAVLATDAAAHPTGARLSGHTSQHRSVSAVADPGLQRLSVGLTFTCAGRSVRTSVAFAADQKQLTVGPDARFTGAVQEQTGNLFERPGLTEAIQARVEGHFDADRLSGIATADLLYGTIACRPLRVSFTADRSGAPHA